MRQKLRYGIYILFLLSFAACDTEGNLNDAIEHGYYELDIKVIYHSESLDSEDYRAEFNGKDIDSTTFTTDEQIGTFQVFKKGDTEALLTVNNYDIEKEGETIELIKLPNSPIEIYKKENFIVVTFFPLGEFSDDIYLKFNEHEIDLYNFGGYFRSDEQLVGTLKFYDKNISDTEPIFESSPIELKDGMTFGLLKMPDKKEFAIFEKGDNEEVTPPIDRQHTKARFMWMPDISSNYFELDSVYIEVVGLDYDPQTFEDILTTYPQLIIKKNKLSEYLDVAVKNTDLLGDGTMFGTEFYYNLYDTAGNLLNTKKISFKELKARTDDVMSLWDFKYKFQTLLIKGRADSFMMGEKWEEK